MHYEDHQTKVMILWLRIGAILWSCHGSTIELNQKFLKASYGWILLLKFGKNSKTNFIKVISLEFLIYKKKSTQWNKVDRSIYSYYTKMKKLRQELNNFIPIPVNNCIDECNVIAKMREYKECDQVIWFIKGLNEQYYVVWAHIVAKMDTPFKKHGIPPQWGMINGQEEDSHSITYDDDHLDANIGKLAFTSKQHKTFLAHLQHSSTLPSHSVNHVTTNSPLDTCIICTIPYLIKLETFILNTGATYHVCYSRIFYQCLKRVKSKLFFLLQCTTIKNIPNYHCF